VKLATRLSAFFNSRNRQPFHSTTKRHDHAEKNVNRLQIELGQPQHNLARRNSL
jgi:hypothetical protein